MTNYLAPRPVEQLDHFRRRVQAGFGGRSRSGPGVTARGQDALRPPYALPKSLQQRGGVRSRPPWHAHGEGLQGHPH
jgi:hypothetical protein